MNLFLFLQLKSDQNNRMTLRYGRSEFSLRLLPIVLPQQLLTITRNRNEMVTTNGGNRRESEELKIFKEVYTFDDFPIWFSHSRFSHLPFVFPIPLRFLSIVSDCCLRDRDANVLKCDRINGIVFKRGNALVNVCVLHEYCAMFIILSI